jgi:hypothetical protein
VLVQADVTRPEDISRVFAEARAGLGPALDSLVADARPDVGEFYRPVLTSARSTGAPRSTRRPPPCCCARKKRPR